MSQGFSYSLFLNVDNALFTVLIKVLVIFSLYFGMKYFIVLHKLKNEILLRVDKTHCSQSQMSITSRKYISLRPCQYTMI